MAFIANAKTSSFLVLICFITFSSWHTTTTEACHTTDRAALLDFKSTISEDPYGMLQTWNQSTDCCTKWEGVGCDSNGRVVRLVRSGGYFRYQGDFEFMIGTISPSLGELEFLSWLDLRSIPASFQNLHKLNFLYLNDNLLSGTVPTNIFQHMSSLSQLDLSKISYLVGFHHQLVN
ncbi:hypothetical protein MKW92_003442 [Papaver armeniacum]|nr:hypothetical protein MKW92_003442 [Papaver armeniacum]